MRGFDIGDTLTTQDRKHTGQVTKIENKIIENELRFIITIDEGIGKTFKAGIDEFMII